MCVWVCVCVCRVYLFSHWPQQKHSCGHHHDPHRGALHGLCSHVPDHVQKGNTHTPEYTGPHTHTHTHSHTLQIKYRFHTPDCNGMVLISLYLHSFLITQNPSAVMCVCFSPLLFIPNTHTHTHTHTHCLFPSRTHTSLFDFSIPN